MAKFEKIEYFYLKKEIQQKSNENKDSYILKRDY